MKKSNCSSVFLWEKKLFIGFPVRVYISRFPYLGSVESPPPRRSLFVALFHRNYRTSLMILMLLWFTSVGLYYSTVFVSPDLLGKRSAHSVRWILIEYFQAPPPFLNIYIYITGICIDPSVHDFLCRPLTLAAPPPFPSVLFSFPTCPLYPGSSSPSLFPITLNGSLSHAPW